MRFIETPLAGAYLVEPEPHEDERGFFARTFCTREFVERGLNPTLAQCSISFNRRTGTLRGLHFQAPPHAETRLVRCTRGRIWDAIADLRSDSPTRLGWWATELSAENLHQLYVPEGFAHGFVTLEDNCEVSYQISAAYAPESVRGYHFASPAFAIEWPLEPKVMSEWDAALELLQS